ncbi:MAG TPA: tetratricopeptide repeat protein [Terriglobales bacterium]|nr:tetratricopeptide repeat protein [Terriglobales bacterium]
MKLKRNLFLRLAIAAGFLVLLFVSGAQAQPSPTWTTPTQQARMGDVEQDYCELDQHGLVVTVLNDSKHRLDRQSIVTLHDQKRGLTTWQTTSRESQMTVCELDFGDYDVEVSAVGYVTEHQTVHITGTIQKVKLEVILHRDPSAVELSASDDQIPRKQRKDAERAVYELKSGNLKDAQKHLDKIYKFAPSSAQLNFLYGYLFLQQRDFEKSESYLSKAASLDPRRTQTLVLLGRVQLQQQQNDAAVKTLEQAVAENPREWMAHNLLADGYLRQKEYEKSKQQAQLALDEGKRAASVAQLVLGQALANLGHDQEGIAALKAFLQSNPNDPTKPQVQRLIATIELRDSGQGGTEQVKNGTQLDTDVLLAATRTSLPVSAWGPPGIDEVKPQVASGVACPADQVLEKAGEGVKRLVDNVGQFAATEDLLHEELDQYGNPETKQTRKFDYVAQITEGPPGYFAFEENRSLRYGLADLPDHIVTRGLVSLALIFHPDMQANYQMTCEGLGQWRGQATWLIYFRQRDDKPASMEDYKVGSETYPIKMKGRAWITADTFEIVHIESELMNSVPQLTVQHQIAEYGPVHFQKKNVDLWLPQSVDLYLELNKHRYYRRHSFDHYMLFSVAAEDKQDLSKIQKSGSCSSGSSSGGACSSGAAAKN